MTVILKFNLWLPVVAILLTAVVQAADPTRPEVQLQQAATAGTVQAVTLPRLSMIRSQGMRHQALIDGQWLKAGEKIGGYQVRSISASQVTLMKDDRSLVLNLFQTTTITK